MLKLSNQIRRAIETCGLTRYRIAKETGVGEDVLSRFMAGQSANIANLDPVAKLLRLTIVMKGPPERLVAQARRRRTEGVPIARKRAKRRCAGSSKEGR